jgi:hypothetical protein
MQCLGIAIRRVSIGWKNLWDHVGFWKETPHWEQVRQKEFESLMKRYCE